MSHPHPLQGSSPIVIFSIFPNTILYYTIDLRTFLTNEYVTPLVHQPQAIVLYGTYLPARANAMAIAPSRARLLHCLTLFSHEEVSPSL